MYLMWVIFSNGNNKNHNNNNLGFVDATLGTQQICFNRRHRVCGFLWDWNPGPSARKADVITAMEPPKLKSPNCSTMGKYTV